MSTQSAPHSKIEDITAYLSGCLIIALGIFFLKEANLLTGGLAGLALFLENATPFSFGVCFFVINCPFYLLAWFKMTHRYALISLICGSFVAIITDSLSLVITAFHANTLFSSVTGGLLIGVGMLMLFRHKASIGGFNILCIYLQETKGYSAGKIQMALDVVIVTASCFYFPVITILWSVVGAFILNLVLTMNHKPHRYQDHYNQESLSNAEASNT